MAAGGQQPLTLNRLGAIAHAWLPAFEASAECEAMLSSQGHTAFHAYREHINQFAAGPEDIALHRRCYLETCKQVATKSPVLNGHPDECRSIYYYSPFLKEKRLALAKAAGFEDLETWLATAKPDHLETEPGPSYQGKRAPPHRCGTGGCCRLIMRPCARGRSQRLRRKPRASGALPHCGTLDRLGAFQDISHRHLSHLGFRPTPTRQRNYAALDLAVSARPRAALVHRENKLVFSSLTFPQSANRPSI